MKTTIYEILGMIKGGYAPKKIWFNNNEWRLSGNDYYCDEEREYLFDIFVVTDILNDEVTILETEVIINQDNKIGKLEDVEDFKFARLIDKINEIIEVINENK